jgi:hypothetical protein
VAYELPITAFRHAPWGRELVLIAEDWSAATFEWAFAVRPGDASLITLENRAAGIEGISASFDPAYVHPRSGAQVGATIITPLMDEVTLALLPEPVPSSADIVLYHTLYATPADGLKRVMCFGSFTIKQGVPA